MNSKEVTKPEVIHVSAGNRFRIPEKFANYLGINTGDYVILTVKKGNIFIEKLQLVPEERGVEKAG